MPAGSRNPVRLQGPVTTRALFSWALYDWANSSFATIIQTFVFAAYFTRQVAENETLGTTQWGNTFSAAALLIAIGGPLLGAITDQAGRRKVLLGICTMVCILATGLLWYVRPGSSSVWPALLLVGLATVGFEYAGLLYNAMLPDLADRDRMGRWSGWGWGLGYAGGLASLVLALLVFVDSPGEWFGLDRQQAEHVRATFPLVSAWYLVFSLPLFLFTPDREASGLSWLRAVRGGLAQLAASARNIRSYRDIVRFLVARMFFIDGLATVFAFGGIYAAGTFDMNEQQILAFGIGMNVTAGLGAGLFALLDDRLGGKTIIILSLAGLLACGAMILLVHSATLFWIFGLLLGIFIGPAQASSRSYLGRVAPEALRNEMFGLLTFSGKATSFLGPLAVGWLTYATGSQRIGMSSVLFFFAIGLLLMFTVPADR
jgi:UMF1 family MFS transporter